MRWRSPRCSPRQEGGCSDGDRPTHRPRRARVHEHGWHVVRAHQLARSVKPDTCITSPPYFRLRDYGVEGQLGLEAHVDQWVEHLCGVFDELARTLKPTGSVWLNVSDSYSRSLSAGAPPKSLLLGPERLLLRLAESGWTVRNKVVWQKSNPMPSSVADRLTSTWEAVYLLTRSRRYFFDLDPVRVPHRSPAKVSPAAARRAANPRACRAGRVRSPAANPASIRSRPADCKDTRSARTPATSSVPPVATTAALTSPRSRQNWSSHCCGQPAPSECARVVASRGRDPEPARSATSPLSANSALAALAALATLPGVVLDPFIGAGTVAVVAEQHDRRWLGIELNPRFARLTQQRLADQTQRRSAA